MNISCSGCQLENTPNAWRLQHKVQQVTSGTLRGKTTAEQHTTATWTLMLGVTDGTRLSATEALGKYTSAALDKDVRLALVVAWVVYSTPA